MRILIVDDEENFRYLLKKLFEAHSVATASDGEEALKIFFQDNDNFDLVITDRKMQGEKMPGEEVIRKIKLSNPMVKTILNERYGWRRSKASG